MNLQAAKILDITLQTFEKEVVQRSLETPVLVDFWAPWCGPCKTLGPALEKLANECAGAFVLAKVDIDQNAELAEAFGVQSVPTVVLVSGGQVVDGFVGAQPESKIKELLARHGVGAEPANDPVLEALEFEKQGTLEKAVQHLRNHVVMGGGDARARAQLARLCALAGRTDEARKLWDGLPDAEKETEPAKIARSLLDLAAQAGDLVPLEAAVKQAPKDVKARLAFGRGLLAARQHERALEEFWTAAQTDLAFEGGEPKKALIEAFGLLGEEHPLTKQYRRKLSVLLCS
ncbi:MAG: thioredoxin [Planctomycetes bacterium]|nr:thioredoxin [Planctomycetota bacterium]